MLNKVPLSVTALRSFEWVIISWKHLFSRCKSFNNLKISLNPLPPLSTGEGVNPSGHNNCAQDVIKYSKMELD